MPQTEIVAKKPRLQKPSLYTEFILWCAMPEMQQRELGLENQKQFAEYHKVAESTLSRWKDRPDFEDRVDKILRVWAIGKTPTVVHGIYRAAVKGNPMSQMLWLQYFKKFNPKQIEDDTEKKVVLSPADIRYMIEILPEELKQKHYGYLQELTEDIVAYRNARGDADDDWDARPEETLPDESDNDAQDIPYSERPDDVARSHTESAHAYMVGPVSENNHQSAERWW